MSGQIDQEPTETRVDVWLWAARFFKTRSLAKQAIAGGKIDVNEGGCKPAKLLRAGDVLRIVRGEERLDVTVLALSERRGPASAAQALYQESEASRQARETRREQHRLLGMHAPAQRPDKRGRRDLRRLKDGR